MRTHTTGSHNRGTTIVTTILLLLEALSLSICNSHALSFERSCGTTNTRTPAAAPPRDHHHHSRRALLTSVVSRHVPLLFGCWWCSGAGAVALHAPDARAAAASIIQNKVMINLESPGDSLGLELFETAIGTPPHVVLAIRRVLLPEPKKNAYSSAAAAKQRRLLLPGMVCRDFTLTTLKERVQSGPYPIALEFENLAAGGDAISDFGTPLVSSEDALQLAQQQQEQQQDAASSPSETEAISITGKGTKETEGKGTEGSAYQLTVLQRGGGTCPIQSRRGDVLEIVYEARISDDSGVIYDSSLTRGTGQPYQMVLGSGDMIPGVDQGLYDMCPGEKRRLRIPAVLAYGRRGNQLFRIPPYSDLVWTVELVSVNSMRQGDNRSREEVDGRIEVRSD